MDHFTHRNGVLFAEDVPLPQIAGAVGTPFYVYSSATLRRHFAVFAEGFAGSDTLVAFAVKSLSNLAILTLLGRAGAGADIVSEGELVRALKAGIPGDRIVFSGVGKTRAEMAAALDAGIRQFNVESAGELAALNALASDMGRRAPVALRVNPDVDAMTDARISTGRKGDKFGIPAAEAITLYREAAAMPGIDLVGLAMHIGSQITSLAPFEAAARQAASMVANFRAEGLPVTSLDLGGGLGIPYDRDAPPPPLPADYARAVRTVTDPLGIRVIVEPGRMIAGNAGLFVTSILLTKDQDGTRYAIVDGAMNDLMRPALYGARHAVEEVTTPAAAARVPHHIAGPVCESTDVFLRDAPLADARAGAIIAFRSAGAYGAVQASQYNTRPLVPEVLVDAERFEVIRRRPTIEEMLSLETIPGWVSGDGS